MQLPDTQPLNLLGTGSWSPLAGLAALLLVPALILVGCDSTETTDPDPPEFSVAAYDTTAVGNFSNSIVVSDVSDGGIGYVDANNNEVNEVTWTSDNVYVLDGFVFVNEGQTLNIEPGTRIVGAPGSAENASALIVASGGTINAEGEPDNPIIFTAQADDGDGLGRDVRGQWGGVILLGDAPLNTQPGTQRVEGIPDDEPRGTYGGDNPDHNVGTFKYVTIRHTGSQLGSGDEIQALTLGGVGNESTVEYVEAYASSDDGFEWFGGTVNTKYLVSAWNADDAFDIDQGFTSNNQFWFVVQSPDAAGRAAEQDGGTSPEDGMPFATPKIYNATYVGIGPGADAEGDNNSPLVIHRDNNASSYFNSLFLEGGRNDGLQIEDLFGDAEDSRKRQEAGDLMYENNFWYNIGPDYNDQTTFEDLIQITEVDTTDDGEDNPVPVDTTYRDDLADYLRSNGNDLLTQSPVNSISRMSGSGGLDPRAANSASSGAPAPNSAFENDGVNGEFEQVPFYGAFGSENWATGWTTLDANGYFPSN
jgi:hypothetical protein